MHQEHTSTYAMKWYFERMFHALLTPFDFIRVSHEASLNLEYILILLIDFI